MSSKDPKLEKAVTQEVLTPDTIDAQFCSDWLKDQIRGLFSQLAAQARPATEEEITLPDRLIRDRMAKAAGEVMRARGWHMEAFACAFWKRTGSWDGTAFRLVERRKVIGDLVETSWQFEWISSEPEEPSPAPEPECPT